MGKIAGKARDWIALALVAGAVPALAQVASETGQPIGRWRAVSIVDQATGTFAYCATENRFSNGLSLAFARNRGGDANIAVGFADARLAVNLRYEMEVAVDELIARRLPGFAADPSVLVVPIGRDEALFAALGEGQRLRVRGPTDEIAFALGESDVALAELAECVSAGIAGREPKIALAPVPERTPPEPPLAATPVIRAPVIASAPVTSEPLPEAAPITPPEPVFDPEPLPTAILGIAPSLELVDVLDTAGVAGIDRVRLIGNEQGDGFDYAWKAGPVFGGALAVPGGAGLDAEMDAMMARIEARCPGAPVRSIDQREQLGPIMVSGAVVACLLSEPPRMAALLAYDSGNRVAVVMHEGLARDREAILDARDQIMIAIEQLASASR